MLESKTLTAVPQVSSVEAARNEVRQAPLDKSKLENLLTLEKQARNFAMVQYLEGRIKLIDEKGTVQ